MQSENQSVDVRWWSTFFCGLMTDAQRKMYSPDQSRAEASFIQKCLSLPKGATVADLPCGDGRLSIEMARLGYLVRGIDISPEIIKAAVESSMHAGTLTDLRVGSMLDLAWDSELDGAFCFGNSFAYFDDAGNERFLKQVARSLKPKGRFVLQTNLVAESILTRPMTRSWYELGDVYFLHSGSYEPKIATWTSDYTLMKGETKEIKQAHYRVYPLRELLTIMRSVGFDIQGVYGGLNHEPFKLGDPSLYVVAERQL